MFEIELFDYWFADAIIVEKHSLPILPNRPGPNLPHLSLSPLPSEG